MTEFEFTYYPASGPPAPPLPSNAGPAEEWSNGPGYQWELHAHSVAKVVFCKRGSLVFHTASGDVCMSEGDRLDIPIGAMHAATVGESGVTCAERKVPSSGA